MDAIAPYWKAVIGFIAPGATVIISALVEASDGGTRVTGSEWLMALMTAIVTAAAVYTVPNKTRRKTARKPAARAADDDPPEHRMPGPAI
jgi:hypothetical protein